jgi:hypothetical protein
VRKARQRLGLNAGVDVGKVPYLWVDVLARATLVWKPVSVVTVGRELGSTGSPF